MSRYTCTKEAPWTKEKGEYSEHPDSKHIRDDYDRSADHDDYAVYECPHCGLRFKETIPN